MSDNFDDIRLSAKQVISIAQSNAPINIWEGAVRSGKTYASLVRFSMELRNGQEGDYAIITRTYDSFKRNMLKQFERIVGRDLTHYSGKREINLWGKTIHIIGADDERAEAKVRGPTFRGAYVDEATIIPESVFRMLISRCAMGGAKIFATTNPDSPFHWLKTDFIDGNPDVKSWQFRLDDNPHLTQAEQDYLRRQYKGLWFQRFIEGRWVQAEGSIYPFFSEKLHVIEHAASLPEYYIVGVDYGTTNPCAFVLVGVNQKAMGYHMWVEDEYYFNSRLKQFQKTDSEYAADLINFVKGKPVRAIVIDPSAASFKLELRKQGVEGLIDADNEVLDGIRFTGDLINNGTLKITRKCTNLVKELQSYVWDPKCLKTGVDKPLKENDHAVDALRYAMYTQFYNKTTQTVDWGKAYREAFRQGPDLPRFFSDPVDRYTF